MKRQKLNLATMQEKLTRDEMKVINGGLNPINDGCTGIIECPTLNNGDSCGTIDGGGCKCSKKDGDTRGACV